MLAQKHQAGCSAHLEVCGAILDNHQHHHLPNRMVRKYVYIQSITLSLSLSLSLCDECDPGAIKMFQAQKDCPHSASRTARCSASAHPNACVQQTVLQARHSEVPRHLEVPRCCPHRPVPPCSFLCLAGDVLLLEAPTHDEQMWTAWRDGQFLIVATFPPGIGTLLIRDHELEFLGNGPPTFGLLLRGDHV